MGWFDDLFDDSSSSSEDGLDSLINTLGSSGSDAPLGGLDLSVPGNYDQLIEQLGNQSYSAPLGGLDLAVPGNYEQLLSQLGSGDYSAPLGGLDMAVPGNYATLMARLLENPESGTSDSGGMSSLLGMLSKFATPATAGAKSPLASLLGLGSAVGQVGSTLTAKGSPALSAPPMTQANPHATPMTWKRMASGGMTPGGCQGALGLLRGGSPGQLDNVPISASHGEYVMDADSVAALGDGNTDAGAARLDKMRENLRRHKRSAPPTKIPPKAKSPEQYLKGAK